MTTLSHFISSLLQQPSVIPFQTGEYLSSLSRRAAARSPQALKGTLTFQRAIALGPRKRHEKVADRTDGWDIPLKEAKII